MAGLLDKEQGTTMMPQEDPGLMGMLKRAFADGGLAGLLGMESIQTMAARSEARANALAESGAPLSEQLIAKLDNPYLSAFGVGSMKNVGRSLGGLMQQKPPHVIRNEFLGGETKASKVGLNVQARILEDHGFEYRVTDGGNISAKVRFVNKLGQEQSQWQRVPNTVKGIRDWLGY